MESSLKENKRVDNKRRDVQKGASEGGRNVGNSSNKGQGSQPLG